MTCLFYQVKESVGSSVTVIFVEVIATDTINDETQMSSEDAKGAAALGGTAADDFRKRVERFRTQYEPVDDTPAYSDDPKQVQGEATLRGAHEADYSYIKLSDYGTKIVLNNIRGYMPGRIAQYLCNVCRNHWSRSQKRLHLSRHGQSEYNRQGWIGGDTILTEAGERYALALAQYADDFIKRHPDSGHPIPCRLRTSTLKVTLLESYHHCWCSF